MPFFKLYYSQHGEWLGVTKVLISFYMHVLQKFEWVWVGVWDIVVHVYILYSLVPLDTSPSLKFNHNDRYMCACSHNHNGKIPHTSYLSDCTLPSWLEMYPLEKDIFALMKIVNVRNICKKSLKHLRHSCFQRLNWDLLCGGALWYWAYTGASQ